MGPWNIPNLGPQMQTVQNHNKSMETKENTFFREDVKKPCGPPEVAS